MKPHARARSKDPAPRLDFERLDDAVKAKSVPNIPQAFGRVYAEAGARFYEVNVELTKICDGLREMLDTMVKILSTARPRPLP